MRQRRVATVSGAILGAVLALALGTVRSAAALSPQEQREEFHQTYPLSPEGRVSLKNVNGAVQISAWDRNEVKLDAIKTAGRPERLKEVRIVVDARPDAIEIRTEYPHRELTFSDDDDNSPASVAYTLMVPRTAKLESIKLVNGSLTIEGVAGDVHGSSVNGRVTATGLAGRADLSTVNGKVEAAFDKLGGSEIKLQSVNGGVNLTLPSDAAAEIRADSVHGNISNDFAIPVDKEFVGRRLAARLGSGGAQLKLNNVNGSIHIRRADDGRPLSSVTNLLEERARKHRFD